MIGFSNIQENSYQSKTGIVLSGMPQNSVYKEEYCNHTLGFKLCVGLMGKNIDRFILLLKNVTENLKNEICLKKSEKVSIFT